MDQTSAAAPFVTDIHPDDHLYGYLNGRFGQDRATTMYFSGGKSDATQAAATIRRYKAEPNAKILEFASGYGRITRHLPALLQTSNLYASDIHPDACNFVTNTIGVETLLSSSRPEDLEIGSGYDFIFVISLFSHLPDWTFQRWMRALVGTLAIDGLLMFTTHGDRSRALNKGLDVSQFEHGDGWVYIRKSDQPDIKDDDYGTMHVEPHYVTKAIAACEGSSLKSFTSAAWFGHQDEWIIQRVK